jgi:hypothetical protein
MADKPKSEGSNNDDRNEQGAGMEKYLVYCEDRGEGEYLRYELFMHEADVELIETASEVEEGLLTPDEARDALKKYEDVLSVIYTGEQQAIFEPHRMKWSDPDFFPAADAVRESPPASQVFWYEADDLGIEGVILDQGAIGAVFTVSDEKAMDKLEEAMRGKYAILWESPY